MARSIRRITQRTNLLRHFFSRHLLKKQTNKKLKNNFRKVKKNDREKKSRRPKNTLLTKITK